MVIAGSNAIVSEVKAARGLSYSTAAYEARDNMLLVEGVLALVGGTPVKAGEETPVAVEVPDLLPNANVQNIAATFTVSEDTGQETSAAQKTTVKVAEGNDERTLNVTTDAVPGLRNVQLRLEQGQVFWTKSGAVPEGSYGIPDFSARVNEYLDKLAAKDNKVTLRFLVKSDAPGKVSIALKDLKYSLLQTQSWKNDLDSTFRVDRTLNLTFNQIERLPVDAVAASGRRVSISELRLDAGGQFGGDRMLGDIEIHDGRQYATVSADFSLAQGVTAAKDLVKTEIDCTGITGFFTADSKAELYVELQPDQSGSPASGTPLAKSNVSFTPADPKDPQPWTFAKFERPAKVKPDTTYWIVVKQVHGSVRLGLKDSSASRDPVPVRRAGLLLNRGGQIWKSMAGPKTNPLEALLSLVYVSQPDNRTAAIQISIGGVSQLLDPVTPARTVHFGLSGDALPTPVLVISSRAQGSVTVANVIQEYSLA